MAMKICRTPVITSIAPAKVMGPLAHGDTACLVVADWWLIEAPLPGSGHSVRQSVNAHPSASHRPGRGTAAVVLPARRGSHRRGLPGFRSSPFVEPCGDPGLGGLQLRDGEP